MNLSSLAILFLLSYIVCTAVHLYARAKNKYKLIICTKPLLIPLLAAYYFSALGQQSHNQWLMICVFAFHTTGDVLLLLPEKMQQKAFPLGLLSFLVGHLFAITWFLLFPLPGTRSYLVPLIMCAIMAPIMFWFCLSFLPPKKKITKALRIYAGIMVMMELAAASTWGSGPVIGTILAMAGIAVFTISDFFIAADKVDKHIFGHVGIMSTYTIAQLLMVSGILLLQR